MAIPNLSPVWRMATPSSARAAETTAVDEWAVGALPAFAALARPRAPWRPHGRGALLLPQAAGTDGMYVLSLRRTT